MITFIMGSGKIAHAQKDGSLLRVATERPDGWGLMLVLDELAWNCGVVGTEAEAVVWVAE